MITHQSIRTTVMLALLATVQSINATGIDTHLSHARVAAGEPVVLTLAVTGSAPVRPDLSPLESEFRILDRASVSDVSEINGRRQERHSLRLTLLPLREGQITIPSLQTDDSATEPMTLEVAAAADAASPAPDGISPTVNSGVSVAEAPQPARNIEIEVSAWPQQVVIGQQVVIRVLIRGDGPLPPGRLVEPGMGQYDVLPLGEERRVVPASKAGTLVDRWEYERRYAFFPHHIGTLELPPLRYSAWPPGADAPTDHESESLRIEVTPAPPNPADAGPDFPWLPATALSLSEAGASSVRVAPGQMIERVVTMKAVGLRAEHLPALKLATPHELQAQLDPPRLWNLRGPDGVTGFRSERVTISAAQPGSFRLPEAAINWWNVETKQWARATSPEWQLEVAALDSASRRPAPDWRRQPPADDLVTAGTPREREEPNQRIGGLISYWPWLVGFLVAALAGLLLWGRHRRTRREHGLQRKPSPSARFRPPERESGGAGPSSSADQAPQDTALDKLASAYRAANAARARQALLDWAASVWTDDPPGNLWQLSLRLPEPIADDIRQLDKAFFSPTPIEWHTAPVATRLSEFLEHHHDDPAVDR
jgi:hypothetical protein